MWRKSSIYRGTYYNNQNQVWRVNIGEHMVFGFIVGSDYYGLASVIFI